MPKIVVFTSPSPNQPQQFLNADHVVRFHQSPQGGTTIYTTQATVLVAEPPEAVRTALSTA